MDDIRFLVELSQRLEYPPELADSASVAADQDGNIISVIVTGRPTSDTYWSTWGGTYDNPEAPELQLYFGQFLQQVGSISVLLATENSFLMSGNSLYLNTPYFPWQYLRSETEANYLEGYSSAPPNEKDPSNVKYETVTGALIRYPVRLKVPSSSMGNKLSDPISGTALYSTFSFELENSDGLFDLTSNTNFFNTPVRMKKSSVKNPKIDDFKTIRLGSVDNMSVDFDSLSVTSADIYRTLDEEVCRIFDVSDYPSAPSDTLGKNIPVAWGAHTGAPLYDVGGGKYIVIDPDYLTGVSAVYDGDDVSIAFTLNADGTITATDAKTCDFTGRIENRIGQIITSEMESKSNIPYREGPWDTVETDPYILSSAPIAIYFDKGKVKELIKKCLENDNAFLISKNDGRLTIRQWNKNYQTHTIPSWMITKTPKKTYVDQKYYASSVKVNFAYNEWSKEYSGLVVNDAEELAISEKWRKKQLQTFDTLLIANSDAEYLSSRLLDRFSGRAEVWTVAIGYDTSEVNPLDKVVLDIVINGRVMSAINQWVVTDVNPAQDTITIEELGSTASYDGELSRPSNIDYDGLMCMIGSVANDAILGQPGWVKEL